MTNPEQLANRLREVVLNGTLIANTNFKSQLENLDWTIATTSYESLNSIGILAQHINYYIAGIKNVFLGGNLEIKDKFSFDFTPISSQNEWQSFLDTFWKNTEELAELISNLPVKKLHSKFVDEKYGTYERNIEGLIEHCYYHLGQIVLINKLIK